jgi:integrase
VSKKGSELIVVAEWRAVLNNNILPTLGDVLINFVKRLVIIDLLEKLANEKGKSAASKAYKIIKAIMDWHSVRDDEFRSPIVKGMWKVVTESRKHFLNDEELKQVWNARDDRKVGDVIGPYVRLLLLTLCRRNELRLMRRSEIAANGNWVIPAERMKGMRGKRVPHLIPLPRLALDILAKIPRAGDSDLIFTNDGKRAIAPKYAKDKIDRVCKIEPWTFHDTRRTSRGLMVRAKVNDDIIERCLAHRITGIKGVYNVYEYNDEKKHRLPVWLICWKRW